MKKYFILLFLLVVCSFSVESFATIRYVKPSSAGTGDGSSWANASSGLQAMINLSGPGDQVWVAQGTYWPTSVNDRTAAFSMKNDVAIYGGFIGTESNLIQRNWKSHISKLSGAIGSTAAFLDNSIHVVANSFLNATAVLDGFTIEAGYAENPTNNDGNGAGMINYYASPTLNHINFIDNRAVNGGGIFNFQSSPQLNQCVFYLCTGVNGGALFNSYSNSLLYNVLFANNSSTHGGAIYNSYSNPTIINNTFFSNVAMNGGTGGGMYNTDASTAVVINTLFAGNIVSGSGNSITADIGDYNGSNTQVSYSCLQLPNLLNVNYLSGTSNGAGNIFSQNPLLLNTSNPQGADGIWATTDDGLQVSATSPIVNAGSNASLPVNLTKDITGAVRVKVNMVDMGVYENQYCTNPTTGTTNLGLCPNQMPYTWNGQIIATGGLYTASFINAAGCDSMSTLNLTIHQTSSSSANLSVCQNQLPFIWNGQSISAPGFYSATMTNAAGCDSTSTLNLTMNQTSTSVTKLSVCQNQLPYMWNGQSISASGNYTAILTNVAGCDSMASLNFTVVPEPVNQNVTLATALVLNNTSAPINLSNSESDVYYTLIDSSSNLPISLTTLGANGPLTISSLPLTTNTTIAVSAYKSTAHSLKFNGVDSYLDAPANVTSNSGTWEAWVSKDIWSTFNDDRLFGNGIDFTSINSFHVSLHYNVGLHFKFGGQNQAGNTAAYSGPLTGMINGSWHHIAVTWENIGGVTTLKIFLDGNQVASATSTAIVNFGSMMYFGGSPGVPFFGPGKMDEIRLWNYARTQTQIQNTMNACNLSNSLGLIGNWTMEDTSGTMILDQSMSNNHATLHNINLNSDRAIGIPNCNSICPKMLSQKIPISLTNLPNACLPSTPNSCLGYISNINFSGINQTSGCNYPYQIFTSTLGQVNRQNNYTLNYSIGNYYSQYRVNIFIDWNQDADFNDAGETYTTNNTANDSTVIHVPWNAALGITRVRVRLAFNQTPTPCGSNAYSEAEDYLIQVSPGCGTYSTQSASACSSYVWNGITYTNSGTYEQHLVNAVGCDSSIILQLTLNQNSSSTTVTINPNQFPYSWNGQTINAFGTYTSTFTNVAGCDSIAILNLTLLNTYCIPTTPNSCFEYISNVNFAGINQTSACNYPYQLFTSTIGQVGRQNTYILNYTIGNYYPNDKVHIFIDWNQDGDFNDGGETFLSNNLENGSATIVVPSNANLGITRLRVRLAFSQTPTPCGSNSYSEAEDYLINIQDVPPCMGLPNPGNAMSNASNICSGMSVTLSLQNTNSIGSGALYQWYNAASNMAIAGATNSIYSTPPLYTITSFYCVVSCGGNQTTSGSVTVNLDLGTSISNPIVVGEAPCVSNPFIDTRVNNNCYSNSYTGANNQASPDIWYQFTLSNPAIVNISHCGSNFDTYVHVLNSTGTQIAANDDNGPFCSNTNASLQIALSAGTYYVVSEGFGSYTGTLQTSIGTTNICNTSLTTKLFLQGYYTGSSLMTSTLANQGIGMSMSDVDSITVELHEANAPYLLVTSSKTILQTNGNANVVFNAAYSGNYYMAIKHRNTIETWSADPIFISSNTSYDFTTSSNKAYGSNMVEIEPGIFALYTGDINQDGYIDGFDYPDFDTDSQNNVSGVYATTDLNGDGYVDGFDYPVFDGNSQNNVTIAAP